MWLAIELPSSGNCRHGHGKGQRKHSFNFLWYRDLYGYKPRDSKGWWGLLWQARECEKLCKKTKRQDLDLVCEGGNIVLTASTSKNPPMSSQKALLLQALYFWMPQSLLLDALSSAPGWSELCSWMPQALFLDVPSPAVGSTRAGPKLRDPHIQLRRQGTPNHTCNCTSHALRVISDFREQPGSSLQSRVATFKPLLRKGPCPLLFPRSCSGKV